jgi:hypothetical protein
MNKIFLLFILFSKVIFAQVSIEQKVDVPAVPLGGKDDVDYVTQMQMFFPNELLKKNITQDVVIYFTVNADGSVTNPFFKQEYEPLFQIEAKRLLRYFQFKPALINNINVASQIFLTFKFNPSEYKKSIKKRGFDIPKNYSSFDTSMVVYTIADSSPEYYKGEDALKEYILNNLEYPDLAVRQNLHGVVLLNFIVEANGTISNLFAEKEFNYLCTKEAYRIMRETKWTPGTKNGNNIRYKMKYPISFNLNNINKDNATSEQR